MFSRTPEHMQCSSCHHQMDPAPSGICLDCSERAESLEAYLAARADDGLIVILLAAVRYARPTIVTTGYVVDEKAVA